MAIPARLPAHVREDHAKHAGAEAQRILARAERSILAAMSTVATRVAAGHLNAQMAKREVRVTTSVTLGVASKRLQVVYDRAVYQVTGETGPLPDAPSQVATAILRAQKDADTAFGAVLAAVTGGGFAAPLPPPSSPYRRIVNRAQRGAGAGLPAGRAALAAISERGLTGYVSPRGRRWPLAAYTERAIRTATATLARQPVMSQITGRRQQLLAGHAALMASAWRQAARDLDARSAVTAFQADSRVASAAAQPPGLAEKWRKEAARVAVFAMLSRLYQSGRYASLVTHLEQAVRDGMAEGQADALAMAAYRQGLAPFDIDAAFRAARVSVAGDAGAARAAQGAADAMIRAAAADIARKLAGAAEDARDDELTGYVDTFLDGDDTGAVARWTEEAIWTAFGAGAVDLYRKAGGQFAGQGIEIDWLTDSSPCAACQENADGSPYTPYDVPSFPGHPHCRCWLSSDTRLPVSLLEPFLTAA
jgi:hypothetical protein